MDDTVYWQLIQDSLNETAGEGEQEEYLIDRLKVMNPQEIRVSSAHRFPDGAILSL